MARVRLLAARCMATTGRDACTCASTSTSAAKKGLRDFREFLDRATDVVLSFGGSLSGEHGDGQARAALLPKMFGPELMQAFREFKALWDPDNRMNPGKLIDAVRVYDPIENLRHGITVQRPMPAAGPREARMSASSFETALRVCARWRIAGDRDGTVRGRGRLPEDRQRRHVPELPRDRR